MCCTFKTARYDFQHATEKIRRCLITFSSLRPQAMASHALIRSFVILLHHEILLFFYQMTSLSLENEPAIEVISAPWFTPNKYTASYNESDHTSVGAEQNYAKKVVTPEIHLPLTTLPASIALRSLHLRWVSAVPADEALN